MSQKLGCGVAVFSANHIAHVIRGGGARGGEGGGGAGNGEQGAGGEGSGGGGGEKTSGEGGYTTVRVPQSEQLPTESANASGRERAPHGRLAVRHAACVHALKPKEADGILRAGAAVVAISTAHDGACVRRVSHGTWHGARDGARLHAASTSRVRAHTSAGSQASLRPRAGIQTGGSFGVAARTPRRSYNRRRRWGPREGRAVDAAPASRAVMRRRSVGRSRNLCALRSVHARGGVCSCRYAM